MKLNLKLVYLTLASATIAPPLFAGVEPTPAGERPVELSYKLVFSDDFSTNPNTNGKWTAFRRQNDLNQEGYWDANKQAWYLTRPKNDLAIAAFANYELTAKVWKVDFNYRADKSPGGADGFTFVFYKDKGAYGVPDSGSYKAFETRNPDNSRNPVPGYGLEFDTFVNGGCDPLNENFVGIVQNVICNSALIDRPFSKIDDNSWHAVEFTFNNGRCACTIDGQTVQGFVISNPDYTYTGVGFGGSTGTFTSDQIIDDVQIWVADN